MADRKNLPVIADAVSDAEALALVEAVCSTAWAALEGQEVVQRMLLDLARRKVDHDAFGPATERLLRAWTAADEA